MIFALSLYLIGKENLLTLFCIFRFYFGWNYYKRVKNWNSQILNFFVYYFLINEFEINDIKFS